MEVGILDRISHLQKSFNSSLDSRLSLDSLHAASCRVPDVKLPTQTKQLVDLYNDQDDEGEIMLLAMILLQLHGVKIPVDDDLLNKKKRQRTSPDQLAILEQIFQTDKMPNQQTRVQLADQLGMSSRRVQIWFQNKRAKVKRSGSKPGDEDSDSSPELSQSSSSISPSSSPSSPSIVPQQEFSPVQSPASPAAVVPQINPLKRSHPQIEAPTTVTFPTTPTNLSASIHSASVNILDAASKQLKAQQQLQYSITPVPSFLKEVQPVLTASY